jgi:uncharacterized Fe-S cluster protein YjdI
MMLVVLRGLHLPVLWRCVHICNHWHACIDGTAYLFDVFSHAFVFVLWIVINQVQLSSTVDGGFGFDHPVPVWAAGLCDGQAGLCVSLGVLLFCIGLACDWLQGQGMLAACLVWL